MDVLNSEELKARLSYNIKRLRKNMKFTQEQLAEKTGLSKDTIQSIENCRMWPSDKTILLICDSLESDASRLFLPHENSTTAEDALYKDLQNTFASRVRNLLNKSIDEIISENQE